MPTSIESAGPARSSPPLRRAADDLVLVTAREIHRHGAPLSLAARPPARPPKLLTLTVESGRPIIERRKARLRSQ